MQKSIYIFLLLILFYPGCQCGSKKNQVKKNTDTRYVYIEPGASRTSGVAPLSVHFTAGFDNSTSATRSFHNFDYTWDFGDSSSGNWGTSGKSKNAVKGPVTTHIFENPGTYTVNLTVKNGTTMVDTGSFNIEVQDPDTVYSGTNTICVTDVANTGDFAGCPPGAETITTDNLDDVMPYIEAGTRILFRRGSFWTSDGLSFPDNAGPVTLGAYGAGTGPDALGIYSNAPSITVTANNFCDLNNKQDWRFTDLHLVDNSETAGTFGGGFNFQRILFQRLLIEGFLVSLGWSHWNNDSGLMTIDQMVVSDCDLKNSGEYIFYGGAERIALLGNIFQNSGTSHVARVWQAYLGVISNNIISGSSINNDNGRHALKLCGPGYSSFGNVNEYGTPEPGTGLLANRTEFTVVSDNVFGSSGPWPVMIAPQDTATDALITDVIFERNRIITNYGIKSSKNVNVALHVTGRYITVRNNIFDGTGSSTDYTAIEIISEGDEPTPQGVEIYNNTIYRSDNTSGNFRIGLSAGNTAMKTIVKNNLVSFPNSGSGVLSTAINNSSPDLIEESNLFTNTAGFIDPDNINPLSANFNLQSGSPAINTGVVVPVYEDINNSIRPAGNYDIGAFEN